VVVMRFFLFVWPRLSGWLLPSGMSGGRNAGPEKRLRSVKLPRKHAWKQNSPKVCEYCVHEGAIIVID